MHIDTVVRFRSGSYYISLPAASARIIAQARGIALEALPGQGLCIEVVV